MSTPSPEETAPYGTGPAKAERPRAGARRCARTTCGR